MEVAVQGQPSVHRFFDVTFKPSLFPEGRCPGCGKIASGARTTSKADASPTATPGVIPPMPEFMHVPVRKDRADLGLNLENCPFTVNLCGTCAIEYMNTFNEVSESPSDFHAMLKECRIEVAGDHASEGK